MNKTIFCSFLKRKSKKQRSQFYPGKLGKKIYEEISEEAWNLWIKKQTILINEKKLNMYNKKDRKILEIHMKSFLFSKN